MSQFTFAAVAGFRQNVQVVHPSVLLVKEQRFHPGTLENVRQIVRTIGRVDIYQNGSNPAGRDL